MVQATILVDEWRSLTQTSAGVRYVIISGELARVMWSAVSWVSLEKMQHQVLFIMVKEVDPSCLIMFAAMAKNHTFGIALIMDGINTPVDMRKMWVWNVCARKVIFLTEYDALVCILLK
jgi:hypothetical protein